MKMYEGDKPCPGCGRTGKEEPRMRKDGLCRDCQESLRIGKAIVKEHELDRKHYLMDDLMKGQLTWYHIPIKEVDRALRNLLGQFSQFDKKNVGGTANLKTWLYGVPGSGTAYDSFVLPTVVFEAAKELCESLYNACWQLREDRENYKKELEAKLAEEKNDIFNEGVKYGRNLLFQLNNGGITLDDFSKRIKRY